MPQTKADSELQLKLDCQAPFFANALLAGVFHFRLNKNISINKIVIGMSNQNKYKFLNGCFSLKPKFFVLIRFSSVVSNVKKQTLCPATLDGIRMQLCFFEIRFLFLIA